MDLRGQPASHGSNGADPPVLPAAASNLSVIFEWVALVPLAIYLASSRLSHQLVGQTALTGFICVGLFPRLGVLGSIADFLQHSPDFLDRASSVSELRRTVWDVNWGSVFPCANGAASDMLVAHVLRHTKIEIIPDEVKPHQATAAPMSQGKPQKPTHNQNMSGGASSVASLVTPPKAKFRRHQTLHILDCSGPSSRNNPSNPRLGSSGLPLLFEVVLLFGLLGVCTVTALFGLYGTAAAIFLSVLFRVSRQLVHVERPSGYLQCNLGNVPGCMLVALHENASTWYLYKGSRSVVDCLLNKTMIQSITSLSGTGVWLAYFLRLLQIVQLLAMTYVAGQKGWDGVALLSLIVVAWAFDSVIYSDERMAALWLQREGVAIEARSFQFSGRNSMIGAIQVLSGSTVTSWMDGILVPSTRREFWLWELGVQEYKPEKFLSDDDRKWVDKHRELTNMAVETIRKPKAEENVV